MRKQVKMRISLDDVITITFHDDYSVVVAHSNRDYGTPRKHKFNNFNDGKNQFWQTIGALYLDGYR